MWGDLPSTVASRRMRREDSRSLRRPRMNIVGGFDVHRSQITFDYLDTESGQVNRGRISSADRLALRSWLARSDGAKDVHFAVEGCTGWRFVAEECAAAGVIAHLADPGDAAAARGKKTAGQDRQVGRPAPTPATGTSPPARGVGAADRGAGVAGQSPPLQGPRQRAHRLDAAVRAT